MTHKKVKKIILYFILSTLLLVIVFFPRIEVVETSAAHTHSYGSWVTTKRATCTTSGSKYRTCTTCSNKETKVIYPLGHNFQQIAYSAPTCTKNGSRTMKCTRCSYSFVAPAGNALGHSFEFVNAPENSCGVLKRSCSVCGTCSHPNVTYDQFLTLCDRQDTKANFCTYLTKRGYTELADKYTRLGSNLNIFVYYNRPGNTLEKSLLLQTYSMMSYAIENVDGYNSDNCYMIRVTYDYEFEDLWNNVIPSSTKNVHLFLHGGPIVDELCFYESDLRPNQIDNLNEKNISNKLYLYACHGGGVTLDDEDYTCAEAFLSICKNSTVVACQGDSVDYTGTDNGEINPDLNDVHAWLQQHILPGQFWPVRNYPAGNGRWIQISYRSTGSIKTVFSSSFIL